MRRVVRQLLSALRHVVELFRRNHIMAPADSNFQCDTHPGTPLVIGLLAEFRRTVIASIAVRRS